jgi:peptide/nickel transport system permease protein
MGSYILRRLLATIPVLAVVALVVFLLLHLGPSDPAAVIAGDSAGPQQVASIRHQLGLDRPLYVQFGAWVARLLAGDLGRSLFNDIPVTTLLMQRLEPTLVLALSTSLFMIAVGIPLGIVAAWWSGRLIDRLVMLTATAGFSLPVFVLGYILIFAFSIKLKLLPVQGYQSFHQGLIPFLRSITLPTLTLGLVLIALLARMTRGCMIEVLRQDYIRTARAKGLAPPVILMLHALKNAGIPIITTVGVTFALLIGGVVVTESVFGIPGIGRLTVEAILQKDYPVIQGVVLVFSFVYVLLNLFIDLSYALIDPRIRYRARGRR